MHDPVEMVHAIDGVILLARKRTEGFARLDISAEGFWRSFWAILYAVPALAVSWASYRTVYLLHTGGSGGAGPGFVARLALIDVVTWVGPLVVIAIAVRFIGIERHFSRFVVATNWLGTLTAYVLALPSALRILIGNAGGVVLLASIAVFFFVIFLLFRITRLSFDGDGASATFVTSLTVIVSMIMTAFMPHALGVAV